MQNLTKERKQPPVIILQKSIFYNIFIRCLWLRIIGRSDCGVQFMNFPSQIFFSDINHGYRAAILKKRSLGLLPFYIAVATCCYYRKVRRTMRTAIVSYLLKITRFWNIFRKECAICTLQTCNLTQTFCGEFLKLWQSIIFGNIFICVEELNYMKDYMKVKITEIACKFAVKSALRYFQPASLNVTTGMKVISYRPKIL